MANYRPKSLNELNQVYGKAMKAEKAIKEGSLSLTKEDDHKENPSDNIFMQMQQQASKAQKNEIYDADIANIANDFIKRFTESDKPKVDSAPKELRRPAPSIKSLYHTPVQPQQEPQTPAPIVSQGAPAPKAAAAVKPKSPEIITPAAAMSQGQVANDNMPKAAQAPIEQSPVQPSFTAEAPQVITKATPAQNPVQSPVVTPAQSPMASSMPHREVSPTVHITSTERSSLMEEYQRVMSDEDDDDTYLEKKPKKRSLFSRKKKYREENEAPFDSLDYAEPVNNEQPNEEMAEDIPVVKFDSTNVKLSDDPSEYPAEEKPMNLYDYIDEDFESDDSDLDLDEKDDSANIDEDDSLPMSQDDIDLAQKESENDKVHSYSQDISFSQDAPFDGTADEVVEIEPESQIEEEAQKEVAEEEVIVAPEEIEEEVILVPEETEEEEVVLVQEEVEAEEVVLVPEEAEAEEVVLVPEEAEAEENIKPEENQDEDLPTSGMVFDDVFSVTDESKRSYSGGNWADVFTKEDDEAAEEDYSQEELPQEEAEDAYDENEDYDESYDEDEDEDESYDFNESFTYAPAPKKKGNIAKKILLSLLTLICVALSLAVVFLGSYIAPDTGKLFLNKYRAFTCEQDFAFIGISDGDLVVTEDYNSYASEGDAFVYVNHEFESFMMGKHSGSTTDSEGNVLFIAENEAGRVLVLREDTLGTIVKTYGGIGSAVSFVSDNYILIVAALLLIILVCILLMVIPSLKKPESKQNKKTGKKASKRTDKKQDFTPAPTLQYQNGDEDDIDVDTDDFDPDGIEEGIFSEI